MKASKVSASLSCIQAGAHASDWQCLTRLCRSFTAHLAEPTPAEQAATAAEATALEEQQDFGQQVGAGLAQPEQLFSGVWIPDEPSGPAAASASTPQVRHCRGSGWGTVKDLAVDCRKEGTCQYSTGLDAGCQIKPPAGWQVSVLSS